MRTTHPLVVRPWRSAVVRAAALLVAAQGVAVHGLAAQGQLPEPFGAGSDGPGPAQLHQAFAHVPGVALTEEAGAVRAAWTDAGGVPWEIVRNSGGDLVISTAIGEVLVDSWRLVDGAQLELRPLIDRWREHPATRGPLAADPGVAATFQWTEGFGDTFGDGRLLIEVAGARRALVAEPTATDSRSAELAALQIEAGRAAARLARSDLPEVARGAVQHVLRTLVPDLAALEVTDVQETAAPTEVLRRLLRHGWLDRVAPGFDAGEVIESLRDAAMFLPTERFVGDGVTLTRHANAFGDRVTVVDDGPARRIALPHAEPPYTDDAYTRLSMAWVEVDTTTDTEPFGAAWFDAADRVVLRLWGRELASWERGAAPRFAPDWHGSLAILADIDHPHVLPDLLPPHVLLQSALGDRHGLLVSGGLLRAPAGAADAERFLDDAARLLPDAGHLDLLGQYLVDYTFDSPDPERPLLIGTETFSGDAQNPPEQTLATACGGTCRGDCDDLATLYVELRRRQGVFAVPVGTPGHLAAAWVVDRGEERAVQVLQTMTPLEFRAATTEAALAAFYRHEAPGRPFDPEACSVPLILAGERAPVDVTLPVRAFVAPDFAADVVRRLGLRHRGLAAASLAAARDARARHPNEFEPRFAEAEALLLVDPQRASRAARDLVARAVAPTTRARARALSVRAALAAGDPAAADLALDRFLGVDLPAVARVEEPLAAQQLALELAASLELPAEIAPCRRLVGGVLVPEFAALAESLVARWSDDGPGDDEAFPKVGDDVVLETLLATGALIVRQLATDPLAAPLAPEFDAAMERYVRGAMAALEAADGLWWDELGLCGSWLALQDRTAALRPDGPLPRWPGGGISTLLDQLDDANDAEWRGRVARWAAVAPSYWGWRAWRETTLAAPRAETLAAVVARLTKVRSDYALVEVRDAFTDFWCVAGRIRCAALLDDRAALAADFAWLGELDDPRLLQIAMQDLAAVGVRLAPEVWRAQLELWCEASGYVAPAFGFAWHALHRGAPEHALLAAEVAHARAGTVDAAVRALGLGADWADVERDAVLEAVGRRPR